MALVEGDGLMMEDGRLVACLCTNSAWEVLMRDYRCRQCGHTERDGLLGPNGEYQSENDAARAGKVCTYCKKGR